MTSVMISLPTWAAAESSTFFDRQYHTDEEMMSLAIHISDRNITEGTGGPFGSAIFERHTNPDGTSYTTLVSVGMNRVVNLGNSTLHGEMVAIQLAQQKVGSFTLCLDLPDRCIECNGGRPTEEIISGEGKETKKQQKKKREFELFTSCEPCAMCLGKYKVIP